jgi:formate dehydrogenase
VTEKAAESAGNRAQTDPQAHTSSPFAGSKLADTVRATGATREVATYCRICDPNCGLIATVTDGRLVSVRGDREHAHSAGFFCTKSVGMIEVTYDPDRVRQPLKRVGGPGEFRPVTWDEALGDIASRLTALRRRSGPASFATHLGNPPALGYATALWYSAFQETLEVKWRYGVNAEDTGSRLVANHLLYGSPALIPVPDLKRTSFAVLIGANPLVSRGSVVSLPHFRDALDDIVARGGRVVVIDPRRSETAKRYEHIGLRAGSDAYLLLALLQVLISEDLVDHAFLEAYTRGFDRLVAAIAPFEPEVAEAATGVPAALIRDLARAFAGAPSALVYGRTGTCTQRFGTLNNLLQDLVMLVTGNVEREGGLVFGWGPIDFAKFAEKAGLTTRAPNPTRVTGLPEVLGLHPTSSIAPDITTPGDGQVRALMTVGGNPVISSSNGGAVLEDALDQLELHFSLDLYVNETNRHAHYVLPVVGMYERDDVPMAHLGLQLEPSIWATEAVIEPEGEARPEWEILDELARRMGFGGAYAAAPLRWLAKMGVHIRPRTMMDMIIRTSKAGDWFGLRRQGVSFRKLTSKYPHGLRLRDEVPVGDLRTRLRTADRRVPVAPDELVDEISRLSAVAPDDAAFPLRLIGMREVRSHNTWMHNSERLMPDSREQRAVVHPDDAKAVRLSDGALATITSRSGSVSVAIRVSDEMTPGNIALAHGWGHKGGWQRANRAGGVNSNVLTSADVADFERLAGMSILNGIPVRIEPCGLSS